MIMNMIIYKKVRKKEKKEYIVVYIACIYAKIEF